MTNTSDPLVQAAVEHWQPRFVAVGVDASDFQRITRQIDSWSEWCDAWSTAAAEYERLGDSAVDAGHLVTAADDHLRAALYYHFAKFLFVDDRSQQRAAHDAMLRAYSKAMPCMDPHCERVEIPYAGWRVPGLLHKPAHGRRPPVVILCPGLDSCKEELTAYARDMTARGLAALAIDGPGQGESEWDHPIEPAYEAVVTAVVDWIASRPDLDPRIGVLGASLGGLYAARAGAVELRLSAVIVDGGGYNVLHNWDELPTLTRRAYQVRQGCASAEEARQAALRLTLEDAGGAVRCPLFVVHGRLDRLVPWQEAQRIYDAAVGPKELLMLEEGNHVCNNLAAVYRPRQADWMADQLAARPAAR